MNTTYRSTIAHLIEMSPFEIEPDVQITGRAPTMASSMFLTNKEQGDWAEEIVLNAINENSQEYCAIKYGRADSLAAGDPGFADFYASYINELNTIGKKPDLLVYKREDVPEHYNLDDDAFIRKAVAAIEVRSSSFLANRYSSFMDNRTREAESAIQQIQQEILSEPYASLLGEKSPALHEMIQNATIDTFRELNFRRRGWYSTEPLRELSELLKSLKEQMQILQKRDYLSITPKVEDLALVNRWIQHFGVSHCYLQVFFDKAYVIPFQDILNITSDPKNEGVVFSIERDVKNQGKTTIKINVQVGKEILGRIDMPQHRSALKELERGRLLFYVTFHGGRGYLDPAVFSQEILDAG